VNIRASIAFALMFAVCDRPVAEACTIAPPDNSTRLIGSDADGIHCLNCRRGPRIENCDIHHLEDDGIVVATHMCIIEEFIDDQTVRVTQEPPVTVAPGDTMRAMSPAGAVTQDLPGVADVEYVFKNELSPGRPRMITFESSVTDALQTGDYLLNEKAANHGYTVRNNTIQNHRASLVRLASGRGEFVNNDLSGSSLAAVELECDTSGTWTPKGWLYDVEIADNSVSRSGLNYINLESLGAPAFHVIHRAGGDGGATPHRDVTIRDNQVTDSGDLGVLVEDASDVTVANNDLSGLNRLGLDSLLGRRGYGMGFENVDGATISNNTVTGASASLSDFGWGSRSGGLSASENSLVVDGTESSTTLVSPTSIRLKFDRTVSPDGDSRELAFYCAALSLHDEQGDSILDADVGGDEVGVSFGSGVFLPEGSGSSTWRWFGGPDGTAVVEIDGEVAGAATALRLDGVPIESGISIQAVVNDVAGEIVDMGSGNRHVVTVPLP
jgi:parallel beta-helix repeat protein